MAKVWIVKMEAEEKKYLESVLVENIDKPLSIDFRKQMIFHLNNTISKRTDWSMGRLKQALAQIRKELGIAGKKGWPKGTRQKAVRLEEPDVLPWERKILKCVEQVLRCETETLQKEIRQLKKERDELQLEVRNMVKIKRAVEELQDMNRKRG